MKKQITILSLLCLSVGQIYSSNNENILNMKIVTNLTTESDDSNFFTPVTNSPKNKITDSEISPKKGNIGDTYKARPTTGTKIKSPVTIEEIKTYSKTKPVVYALCDFPGGPYYSFSNEQQSRTQNYSSQKASTSGQQSPVWWV